MPRQRNLHLTDAEDDWLREEASGTPLALVRALMLEASEDPALLASAKKHAADGGRIGGDPPGKARKDISPERYREAIEERGSLTGAAEALGVHRSSVRYMAAAYEIHVPSMGRVPEQLEKYK